MSNSKLKRDIELLEQQLNELEANIFDPIERIEQKKQLQREIRKLERSKSQIEQLEQEQQELENLKSEFLSKNNELVDENKSERFEQAEFTLESNTSLTNKSMALEPEIKLGNQIENSRNSQVSNTHTRVEKSDTSTNLTPSYDNSKRSGKAWIIGGTIGFFIFLGLIINGNRANQTVSSIEQQASETIPSETFQQDNSSETEEIIESSPEVSTRLQEQNFNSYNFPLDSCGDQDPSGANIWYRVYIDDTPENLNTIHSNYCRDAIRKYRQNEQINSIQVAAFTDESKAEAFAQLMRINIGSGEVGELSKDNLYTESITTTSPREFVINHYSELNNRNYNSTWQHLTPEFQAKSKDFYGYTDWWNSVENIEIGEIQVLEQNNNRAVLDVSLKYFMKTGSTYKDPKSRIYLIWDNSAQSWLFENKQ
jgi:hypothetical protein